MVVRLRRRVGVVVAVALAAVVLVVGAVVLVKRVSGSSAVDPTHRSSTPPATARTAPVREVDVDWRRAHRDIFRETYADPGRLAAASPDDVWYVGPFTKGVIHYDGDRWRTVKPSYEGHQVEVEPVMATSDSGVWLAASWTDPDADVDDNGIVYPCTAIKHWALRWDGSRWIGRRLPCGEWPLFDVNADGEMWYYGWFDDESREDRGNYVHRWNGSGWTRQKLPFTADLRALDVRTPEDVWAAGLTEDDDSTRPFVAHWDGTSWKKVSPPPVAASVRRIGTERGHSKVRVHAPYVTDVHAVSEDEVWAVVRTWTEGLSSADLGLLYRWDGKTWHEEAIPHPDTRDLRVTGVTEGADGQILCTVDRPWAVRWTGDSWERLSSVGSIGKRTTLRHIAVAGRTTWAVAIAGSRDHETDSERRKGAFYRAG